MPPDLVRERDEDVWPEEGVVVAMAGGDGAGVGC